MMFSAMTDGQHAGSPFTSDGWLSLVDALEDGVLCISSQEQVLLVNHAAESFLGLNRLSVQGRLVSDVAAVAELLVQMEWERLRATPPPIQTLRLVSWRQSSGDTLVLGVTITDFFQAGQRIFAIVLRDVRRTDDIGQALNQSQKAQAISVLASGIAHDFNNVFTGILSHLDLALFAGELPSSIKEYLGLAQTSARRGVELVGKLATFSRKSEPKLKSVFLGKCVEQVVAVLRRTLDPRICIQAGKPAPETGWAQADESQIVQVLLNLCMNARDAMPGGGQLSIEIEDLVYTSQSPHPSGRTGSFVCLSVSDTGEGMPPETIDRLFEPYFTTKSLAKSAGLGLSISFNIIRAHHGWMEIQSQPGQGSRFLVYLPRAKKAEPSTLTDDHLTENAPAASGRVQEGRETILVADDEELVRLVVRAVLSYRGYKVVDASSGEQALDRFQESPDAIALAVLDVHMPRMTGWDTLSKLRQLRPSLPAILLSGSTTDGEIERAEQIGNVSFLAKPFENHELARLVRRILDAPKQPDRE
jgi:two-component system, cell cycle sensor histidine kinase and response regulator CckA